jgi:beta-phosphoglucomutase family hydrolase
VRVRRCGYRVHVSTPLGLPDRITALLFDLDGVLTRTAAVHARAWKETFDRFLSRWQSKPGDSTWPFDIETDYPRYVDGLPRLDGVRSFLASRRIELPEGTPDDGPSDLSIHGIGRAKDDLVQELIARDGVETFPDSIDYVRRARDAGLACAVVSSSANTKLVLEAVGITDLFQARIDGIYADEHGLPGKPAPDTFLAGARALGAEPEGAAVFEDAIAGVKAGAAGGFGLVVGVDRVGPSHAEELKAAGADRVVQDLADLAGHEEVATSG